MQSCHLSLSWRYLNMRHVWAWGTPHLSQGHSLNLTRSISCLLLPVSLHRSDCELPSVSSCASSYLLLAVLGSRPALSPARHSGAPEGALKHLMKGYRKNQVSSCFWGQGPVPTLLSHLHVSWSKLTIRLRYWQVKTQAAVLRLSRGLCCEMCLFLFPRWYILGCPLSTQSEAL